MSNYTKGPRLPGASGATRLVGLLKESWRAITPGNRVHLHGHKTPRTVHALFEGGAPRTEIARRTGLPIDAVNMLLAIQGAP